MYIIYDKYKNKMVHLLSKSGYEVQYHLKVSIYELIPKQMFRMELIFGYLRLSEKDCQMMIPFSLYYYIEMFYPTHHDVKPLNL